MHDENQTDRLVGQLIADRYLIEEKIGEGGIGSVYRASDSRVMGRKVVVKVLLDDWAEHGDVLRKFEHEKEALARLDHPAIVNILDAGTIGGKSFFVMPFVEGLTLRQFLDKKGRPDLFTCAHIIESITDALAAAHSKGVLHRDVKPGNIMLSELPGGKLRVLLIDFGIARVSGSETSPVTEVERPLGTVLYGSPEQLEGNLEQTPAADIFSFAVVAYELLTGELPFKPTSIYHMVLLQFEGLKVLPSALDPDIPASIDRLLAKALKYDRNSRPQNVSEFGDELADELRRLAGRTTVDTSEQSRITLHRRPLPTDLLPDRVPSAGPAGNHVVEQGHDQASPSVVEHQHQQPSESVVEVSPSPARVHIPIETPNNTNEPEAQVKVGPSDRRSLLVPAAAVAAVILIGLAVAGGWVAYRFVGRKAAAPAAVPEQRSVAASTNRLQYQLLVKNSRQAAAQTPRATDGSEVFTSDWEVAIDVIAMSEGYLYLYDEAEAEPGKFHILFPTASQHAGRAQVAAGEEIRTDFNVFEGPPGRDFVWLIWTRNPVRELEAIREKALETGTLNDTNLSQWLRDYLGKAAGKGVEAGKDGSVLTTLSTNEDHVVHRIDISHK